jgi:hypothetical protein
MTKEKILNRVNQLQKQDKYPLDISIVYTGDKYPSKNHEKVVVILESDNDHTINEDLIAIRNLKTSHQEVFFVKTEEDLYTKEFELFITTLGFTGD